MSTEPTNEHNHGEREKVGKPSELRYTTGSQRDAVVPLEALRRNDVERGGGKGANLGELLAAGLPVPPGFCVTTTAYRRAIAEDGLTEAIDDALQDIRNDDPESIVAASVRIAALFESL